MMIIVDLTRRSGIFAFLAIWVSKKVKGDPLLLMLALSLGACLGGNGTLVGASANLIVAGIAEKNGIKIRYIQFLKVGFPIMLLSVIISAVYLVIRYY